MYLFGDFLLQCDCQANKGLAKRSLQLKIVESFSGTDYIFYFE